MTERLAFVTMFTVMAAFVVGLAVLAVKTGGRAGTSQPLVAVSARTETVRQGGQGGNHGGSGMQAAAARAGTWSARPSEALSARVATALRAALGTRGARLSVGVADLATGAEALYRPAEQYHAGGITGADILAALLYQHQRARTPVGSKDFGLAAEMIENGSNTATASLWQAVGRGVGLATTNRALGLRPTIPGTGSAWRLTGTTVADQLQLLAGLAATHSALSAVGRAYELGLIASQAAARPWGVPAAAGAGTSCAVSDAWRPGAGRFVVNSIGIIDRGGHEFLVVILSRDWPTKAAGISAVRAAAVAAVSAMLRSP